MHSASSSSCISLNGSSYTHAAIGGELLPACVGHRPHASNATAPVAAVISWLSRSSRTDIRRFIEYYILLGAERFAILDNLCNASAVSADEALAPYVASGHVVHLAKYRCLPWSGQMQMKGYGVAQAKLGLHSHAPTTLVLKVDEDEFVSIRPATHGLDDVRRQLVDANVCALFLLWRQFGTSGHQCQPAAGLVASFTRRAPTVAEATPEQVAAAIADAKAQGLNPPFVIKGKSAPGKAVFVGAWEGHCGLHGCTHCRRGTNTTNCGLPQHLGGASCAPLVQRTVLNHYAYQSQEAWAAKKRGNVLGRKGAVPEIYEKVRDDTGVELLSERIRLAHAATPRYGRCLGALFFGRGDS